MGELEFRGIDNSLTARLRAAWKIRPGDVYDSSYLKEFLPRQKVTAAYNRLEVAPHVTAIAKTGRWTWICNIRPSAAMSLSNGINCKVAPPSGGLRRASLPTRARRYGMKRSSNGSRGGSGHFFSGGNGESYALAAASIPLRRGGGRDVRRKHMEGETAAACTVPAWPTDPDTPGCGRPDLYA